MIKILKPQQSSFLELLQGAPADSRCGEAEAAGGLGLLRFSHADCDIPIPATAKGVVRMNKQIAGLCGAACPILSWHLVARTFKIFARQPSEPMGGVPTTLRDFLEFSPFGNLA